ncbi:ABC transporter permease [Acidocella aquatica]|uniref:Xylose transport system permease protein XylH n=1 Tax=Acidocella aquatica TaxID=1922313 RepID=A0ABQ6ADY6_9PROT|nr:ATPase [Acidocella aquatica]GLR68857.1 ABC transporter permease [Acidocella aquatica]
MTVSVDNMTSETQTHSPMRRWTQRLVQSSDLGMAPVIAALVVIWAVFEILNPHFLTARNISNLSAQIVVTGTLALAETFVILLGMIDLSIGWSSVVAAAVFSVTTVFLNWPVWPCVGLGIGASVIVGMLQGLLVSRVGVPSFVVSLGGAMIAEGVSLAMLTPHGGSIPLSDNLSTMIGTLNIAPTWSWILSLGLFAVFAGVMVSQHLGRMKRGAGEGHSVFFAKLGALFVLLIAAVGTLCAYRGVPWLLLIFMAALFICAFLTKSTRFGRHLYAVGGNAEASRRAGINVRFIQLAAFTIAGALVGLGGLLDAARLGVASATVGDSDIMLNAVAAAVIGGTSLFGGRGSVYGALFGALVIASVTNGMDLIGAPSSIRFGVEGVILLVAITIDTLLRQRRLRSGRV